MISTMSCTHNNHNVFRVKTRQITQVSSLLALTTFFDLALSSESEHELTPREFGISQPVLKCLRGRANRTRAEGEVILGPPQADFLKESWVLQKKNVSPKRIILCCFLYKLTLKSFKNRLRRVQILVIRDC